MNMGIAPEDAISLFALRRLPHEHGDCPHDPGQMAFAKLSTP